jgi:uncharacterized membrane protein
MKALAWTAGGGAAARLRVVWWRLRGSLWFLPSVLVAAATLLAIALVEIGDVYDLSLQERWPRVFGVGAEGSRGLLTAIATAMLTVAGTMFSVTLAVLSLAASQYSPRVLRTFISDRPTQVVLGFFVAVFAYCLVVLRTIRGGEAEYVPSLAVLGGIVLGFVAIGLLVYFIHHLAASIEASTILERLTIRTRAAIGSLFPEDLGEGADESVAAPRGRDGPWTAVPAPGSGYVVSLDNASLLAAARELGRVVRMERGIGDFVVHGQPLVSLRGAGAVDERAAKRLARCFSLERQRTVEQDPAFGLQQISDIALKALSPGINDQSTATLCVDRQSELLVLLARRRIVSRLRRDEEGLRVVALGPTFETLVATALADLCESAAGKPAVLGRIVEALERIARETSNPQRRATLAAMAERVGENGARSIVAASDRQALLAAAAALRGRLTSGDDRPDRG